MSTRQSRQTEQLSEEEKEFRALGLEFLRLKREIEGLANTTVPNLIDHLNGLGLSLQKAQEEAQQRRIAKQIEDKRPIVKADSEPDKSPKKKKNQNPNP